MKKLIYKQFLTPLMLVISLFLYSGLYAQNKASIDKPRYTFKDGDVNGIGKWYMGREIAGIMSYRGISWLERSSRESEENTSKLIKNIGIEPGEMIADIGAGSGYHVFKMAPMVGEGFIYAVDIQEEMLAAISDKMVDNKVKNIKLILGNETTTNLPDNAIDKVVMVDVYHEFSHPFEMLQSIKRALRPDGKVYLLEYKAEDPSIRIKEIHKMSLDQAKKEFAAAGFKFVKNIDNLPLQHCMIFEKQL